MRAAGDRHGLLRGQRAAGQGTDWAVPGELKCTPLHKRAWRAPWIRGIDQALGRAYLAWSRGGSAWRVRQERARAFGERYDADFVFDAWWRPVLGRCEAGGFKVDSQAKA